MDISLWLSITASNEIFLTKIRDTDSTKHDFHLNNQTLNIINKNNLYLQLKAF